jgi:hypothetical protein
MKKVMAGRMGNSPKAGIRRNIVLQSFRRKEKRRLAAASSLVILWS